MVSSPSIANLFSSVSGFHSKLPSFLDELIPEITKKFANQTAAVGEPVKFAVEFEGKPKRVQWFLKGEEIFPDTKYQVSYIILG